MIRTMTTLTRRHDLPTLHPVDKTGRFGPEMGPYAGLPAKEADRTIIADLNMPVGTPR